MGLVLFVFFAVIINGTAFMFSEKYFDGELLESGCLIIVAGLAGAIILPAFMSEITILALTGGDLPIEFMSFFFVVSAIIFFGIFCIIIKKRLTYGKGVFLLVCAVASSFLMTSALTSGVEQKIIWTDGIIGPDVIQIGERSKISLEYDKHKLFAGKGPNITWRISEGNSIEIKKDGTIKGIDYGLTTIIAEYENQKFQHDIFVENPYSDIYDRIQAGAVVEDHLIKIVEVNNRYMFVDINNKVILESVGGEPENFKNGQAKIRAVKMDHIGYGKPSGATDTAVKSDVKVPLYKSTHYHYYINMRGVKVSGDIY